MLKGCDIKDILVFFLIGSLYAWSLNVNIISTTVLTVHFFDIYIITVLFLLVFFVICCNKITLGATLGCLSVIFLYLLYYAFFAESLPEHLEDFYEYVYRLMLFIRGYGVYETDFSYSVVAIIAMLITLYTTIFMFISFNFVMLTVLGFILFGISWITGYESIEMIYITFLFTFLVLFVRTLNNPKSRKLNGQFSLTAMPLCLFLIIVSFAVPAPKDREPVDIYSLGESIQRPYNFINDVIYEAFNPKYFSMQTSGFSGADNRLGGKVNLNNRYVMSVYSDKRVYLTGATKDTYTGYSWTNSNPNFYPKDIDTYGNNELYYLRGNDLFHKAGMELTSTEGFYYIEPNFVENDKILYKSDNGLIIYTDTNEPDLRFLPIGNITIDTGANRIGTVFRPLGTLSLRFYGEYDILVNEHNDIRTDRLIRPNTQYTMQYLDVDRNNLEILKQSVNTGANDRFTQLPDTIPERVFTLTENITQDYNDNYSKIKRIEAFLNTYDYNLSPETPPLGVDFVDYFLFEGREGYCTYYASAMVVMSRIIGMPARYVEGYIMPERKNEYGAYVVTNRQAHAWAEVYFEGFGWVAFEPTSPFTASFYTDESRPAALPGGIVFTDSEYDYYEEMGLASMLDRPQGTSSLSNETTNEESQYTSVLRIVLIPGLIAIVFILITFINSIRHEISNFKLRRLNRSEKICEYFKKILQIAAVMGYSIHDNETVKNYSQRVGKSFSFKNEKYFISDLADIFSKAKYGNRELTEDEELFISEAYDEMLIKAMNRFKRYQYIFYRYVMYKF